MVGGGRAQIVKEGGGIAGVVCKVQMVDEVVVEQRVRYRCGGGEV